NRLTLCHGFQNAHPKRFRLGAGVYKNVEAVERPVVYIEMTCEMNKIFELVFRRIAPKFALERDASRFNHSVTRATDDKHSDRAAARGEQLRGFKKNILPLPGVNEADNPDRDCRFFETPFAPEPLTARRVRRERVGVDAVMHDAHSLCRVKRIAQSIHHEVAVGKHEIRRHQRQHALPPSLAHRAVMEPDRTASRPQRRRSNHRVAPRIAGMNDVDPLVLENRPHLAKGPDWLPDARVVDAVHRQIAAPKFFEPRALAKRKNDRPDVFGMVQENRLKESVHTPHLAVGHDVKNIDHAGTARALSGLPSVWNISRSRLIC